MVELMSNFLASWTEGDIARIRFLSMFFTLIIGVVSSYLARNHLGLSENVAKKLMDIVLGFFSWSIALLIIWPMQLSKDLIWISIIGAAVMLIITGLSWPIFSLHRLNSSERLTLVLAGGLSNMGYTGGSFVCYALFGLPGLALGHIYLLLWLPVVYLVFLPLLKLFQLHNHRSEAGFSMLQLLDYRMLIVPAIIAAIILNLADVKMPDWPVKFHIIDILIYTAAVLAFFAIGLRVTFHRLKNYMRLYFTLSAVKFLLTPAVAFLLLWFLAFSGRQLGSLARNVVMIQAITPCAVAMVTIANAFDLDARLASAVWVVSTAAFVLLVAPVLFFVFL